MAITTNTALEADGWAHVDYIPTTDAPASRLWTKGDDALLLGWPKSPTPRKRFIGEGVLARVLEVTGLTMGDITATGDPSL